MRLAIVAVLALLLAAPASALATVPGANGAIAFVRDGDIWTINPNGTDLRQVTSGPAIDRWPAWSPDGTTIAFARSAPPTDADPSPQSDIWLVRPGGIPTRFTNTTTHESGPEWAPDGQRLSFTRTQPGCAGVIARLDGGASVGTLPPGGYAWSPDGTRVAVAYSACSGGVPGPLGLADPVDGSSVPFPGNDITSTWEGFDASPSWSPDGSRIAYSTVRWGNSPGSVNTVSISLIRADGGGVTHLTGPVQLEEYGDSNPVWSPDGRQIAFTRSGAIWLMAADGSGAHPITAGSEPDWQRLPVPAAPQPQPSVPVQSTPLTPTPPVRADRDPRCQRLPKVIRATTKKMVATQRAVRRAKTRAAKRAATKRLRALSVQRERYRAVHRAVCLRR